MRYDEMQKLVRSEIERRLGSNIPDVFLSHFKTVTYEPWLVEGNPLEERAWVGPGVALIRGFGGPSYQSGALDSPRWIDLCVEVARSIYVTGDHHHVFLEGVRRDSELSIDFASGEVRVPVYVLELGS